MIRVQAHYTDEALVADFNRGQKKAFEVLFDRYYERLVVFVRGIIKDKEEAKDIVQDVFIKLVEKKSDFDKIRDIESFLYVAARNRCIDHFRKQRVLSESQHLFIRREYGTYDLLNDILDGEFLHLLKRSVESLPERSRQIVELYYVEELKYKEIAEKLNISDRTVESTLRSALQKLRQALGQTRLASFLFLIL